MNKDEFLFWLKILVVFGIMLISFCCSVVEGCARVKASYNYLTTGKIFEEDSND